MLAYFYFSANQITWFWILLQIHIMTNSADPDQLASEEANWSGSTLLARAEYIHFQQDKG